MNNSYTFLDGYISWITSHVGSTSVSHSKRQCGKSSYTLKGLFAHFINIFVTFSSLPIRLLTFFSLLIFVFTLGYSGIILYKYYTGSISIPGYSSIIIVIGLGIGFILLGLGIIGEYIYQINLKTTNRPNFIEDEII